MLEEEQKAIKTIKSLKEARWYSHAFDNGTEILDEEEKKDIDVILNLISKLQSDIEIKDKVIDELISEIIRIIYYYENHKQCDFEYEIKENITETREKIEQYFYKKASEENE